ncbi:replication factor RFC1 C terminal domain-containing protein [Colletotrichum karsti]|uniref:Replication factor C subunit 1 n=1 Tax=Colletotrichum karsti TaxID=1095194 RepID=A0A9P6LIV0_9PEZI|nr:replication factor RFC1 C terminal domain-containing protein [Colletotrichum karsti]KAF9877679.1 replication factor RFC1 C terminal domain-containing protein [Colletotrichum karsti]
MPADIRSFFGPKGGAPPKPAPKKVEEPPKSRRGRKVVEDSDDDDEPAPAPKPVAKAAEKKRIKNEEIKGTETTASDYFASSKSAKPSKAASSPKIDRTSKVKTETEVRTSPRTKKTAAKPTEEPSKNGTTVPKKRSTTAYKKYDSDDDADAYVDEDDNDDDGDIFAADIKGRNKRKNDDYAEDESDDEVLPKPKRVASRSAASSAPAKSSKAAAGTKRRKTPEEESEDDEEEQPPPKKKAPAKPRAPRAKKADEPEDATYQSILDDIPMVRPPTPPARDPNAKFDWRKANAGGGNSSVAPPNAGAAELPVGEDECLSGLTFVFTGVLQTIGREEGQALVKKYGGKVTGAPSSKTSYVVLGDDAGPSKLKKIKDIGIKTINEEGLFELIRRLPAYGGSGKGAEKAREKKKQEEENVKKQAEEMEREEKARKAAAEKAAKQAAAARGTTVSTTPAAAPVQLLTSKYAPTQLNHICGNKSQVEKIQAWLRNWAKARKYDFQKRGADGMGGTRAIIISGPPGIGKTTAAHLAAKLEGFDVIESNASDTRSKKLVENGVSDIMNNTSLMGYFAGDGKQVDGVKKNIVLIMDEVDGMSAGDRGGVGALAKFCKKTEVPLILICNERKLPKMKPFDFVAMDIPFRRPTVEQVRSRIMTICHREGLKLPVQVVDALIEGSNKDIRQIINMISTAKLDQASMNYDQGKAMTKAWEKHVVLKPWDICQKMLAGGLFTPASKTTLNEKIELYFNDHEFSYLMIQENYLRSKPMALNHKGYNKREENLKYLELVDQAAESISDGDLVDRMIHGPQQQWSLMPTHAVFSTVRPSSFVAGQLMGSNFTSWLGNNSKTGKLSRFVRELHSHMRLRSSGDANEIRQQYLPVLWDQLIRRLSVEGRDCVDDIIQLMDSYYLTRDDFDAIQELGVGPQAEGRVDIESKTKAAFTRTYNAMSHPIPFMKASNVLAPKKTAKEAPDLEEAIEEEDDADVVEPVEVDEDEIDLKKDKLIKQPKPKAKKATKKAKEEDEDEDEDAKPKRGRPKGKTTAAKGKAFVNAAEAVRAHSPHQLSMIEEASRESTTTLATRGDKSGSENHLPGYSSERIPYQDYDCSDIPEDYMQGIECGADEAASNVGPHDLHRLGLTQNAAETVLYGAWEQDNNLEDLNRCSTPDTVIHYDLDEMDEDRMAFSSTSSAASYQLSSRKEPIAQNASFRMVGSPRARDWSMFQSNLVDYGADEPTPRVPGCSANHPFKKTWKLTDSMVIAYNAMRGPMLLPGNDALRNWMVVKANETMNESVHQARHATEQGEKPEQQSDWSLYGKRTVKNADEEVEDRTGHQAPTSPQKGTSKSHCLVSEEKGEIEDYAKMLREANMVTKEYAPPEADRKPAYEVPRPRYLHLSPKFERYKFEDYIPPEVSVPESAYRQPFDPDRDFVEEFDISDDEGDPDSGRISPCTFRLLAEGCFEGDPKANQVFMADDAQRMRPETPTDDRYRRISIDRLAVSFELQRDVNDGGWLTPCYSVDSEPSIIWTPPGVNLKHKMRNWWFGLFDRMDPIAARSFRKIQFREANDPVTPLETSSERSALSSNTSSEGDDYRKPYTEAEILEVLHDPSSRRVAGVAPQNAPLILSQRWQTVTRWKAQDDEVARENDNMRGAIERAKIELREIRLTVDHLLQKKAAEEMAMRQRKHKRILRQVSAHLHELRYEIKSKFDALKHAQTQNQSMKAELALLEWQIKNECARAELASPDDVRKAVSEHFRDKMANLDLAECF